MLTATKLARRCGVSRTALLYYESIGLMPPPQRAGGNYQCYSESDAERLRAIRTYRNAGLTLDDIRAILRQTKFPETKNMRAMKKVSLNVAKRPAHAASASTTGYACHVRIGTSRDAGIGRADG
jgi:DNA-binding transcriptional MerR regulator